MDIELSPSLSAMGIHILTAELTDISVWSSRKEVFTALCDELKIELRGRFRDDETLTRDRTVRALRDLFWKIGIDPTKTRPASEALVRRLLKRELPTINNLVDAGNLASASTMVPLGLYDMDRIKGKLMLRPSVEKEHFQGIGGTDELLAKGVPILSDDEGVMHVYPHRDCTRTRITQDCRNALVVACGAKGIGQNDLLEALSEIEYYFEQLSV
ncbi:MAG: phenylalanine--tRNA ligase beta subunit-related protein [Candidatus Thermoplasmatota archaeon]|nr:phenylalanine--tRNA ligase beta subunit-related protein [Candidatus Thermoplasmatota archaeon]